MGFPVRLEGYHTEQNRIELKFPVLTQCPWFHVVKVSHTVSVDVMYLSLAVTVDRHFVKVTHTVSVNKNLNQELHHIYYTSLSCQPSSKH